jgi:hypothetical protein
MLDFPEFIRLPVRDAIDAAMSWLLQNLSGFRSPLSRWMSA